MSTLTTERTYTFDQLSPKAKKRAIQEVIDLGYLLEGDWWGNVYSDAKQAAFYLGIAIEDIRFEGFGVQGSHASYKGMWDTLMPYKGNIRSLLEYKSFKRAIRSYAPKDKKLYSIAESLDWVVAQEDLYAHGKLSARISLDRSISLNLTYTKEGKFGQPELEDRGEEVLLPGVAEKIREALGSFADWIFAQLEKEHDYLHSEEAAKEFLEERPDVRFYKDGNRFRY